uniref:Uncharacterized protein n=1 Tax=viral metagenome TaxID=1070528 RepID=A0A6C0CEQ5_9ZZZZ
MNIDKSLYMKNFLELRNNLGSVHNLEAKHILHTNLYNEFLPREIKKKVEAVVEEIEEKTILLKGKKDVLFDDLPDVNVPEEVVQESPKEIIIDENDATDPIFQNMDEVNKDELKKDKLDGGYNEQSSLFEGGNDIDIMGGGRELKKIVINPNYVALDK